MQILTKFWSLLSRNTKFLLQFFWHHVFSGFLENTRASPLGRQMINWLMTSKENLKGGLMIRQGDIFCVNSGLWISTAITKVTGVWSTDGEAKYSHAGIITDPFGGTFESLRHIEENSLFGYVGKPVIIGRHDKMATDLYRKAFDPLKSEQNGRVYPLWRIALFLIPPLARKIGTGDFLVCSELVAKFLKNAGILTNFTGWTPDCLADMIRDWKHWKIVYEGILTEDFILTGKVENEFV
jgi:hypothetical protein